MTRVNSAASAARGKRLPRGSHRHKIVFESISQEKKRRKLRTVISFRAKAPPGYTFIPAGNPSLTQKCKDLSRVIGKQVFIVSTSHQAAKNITQHVHRIGYHFATTVVHQVCQDLNLTVTRAGRVIGPPKIAILPTRQQKDPAAAGESSVSQQQLNAEAEDALADLFPKIPTHDKKMIIARAFKQGKNKVGTAANLPMPRRVQLAVVAHIRHVHTQYDSLLRTTTFHDARAKVEAACLRKLTEWRGDDENDKADAGEMEEILREVIVISDDEDESDEEMDDDDDDGPAGAKRNAERDSSVEFISSNPVVQVLEFESTQASGSQGLDDDQPYILDDAAEGGRRYAVHRIPSTDARKRPRLSRRGFHRYSAFERLQEDENRTPTGSPVVDADGSTAVLGNSPGVPSVGYRPGPGASGDQQLYTAIGPEHPLPERPRPSSVLFPPQRTDHSLPRLATVARRLEAAGGATEDRGTNYSRLHSPPPRIFKDPRVHSVFSSVLSERPLYAPRRQPVMHRPEGDRVPMFFSSESRGPLNGVGREIEARAHASALTNPHGDEADDDLRGARGRLRPVIPAWDLVVPSDRDLPAITSHRSLTAGSTSDPAPLHRSSDQAHGESRTYPRPPPLLLPPPPAPAPAPPSTSEAAYEEFRLQETGLRSSDERRRLCNLRPLENRYRVAIPVSSEGKSGPGCFFVEDAVRGAHSSPYVRDPTSSFLVLEDSSQPRRLHPLPSTDDPSGRRPQVRHVDEMREHVHSSHEATARLPFRSVPVHRTASDLPVRESGTRSLFPSSDLSGRGSFALASASASSPLRGVLPGSFHGRRSPHEHRLPQYLIPVEDREEPRRKPSYVAEAGQGVLPPSSHHHPPPHLLVPGSSSTWDSAAPVFCRASARRPLDHLPQRPVPARRSSEEFARRAASVTYPTLPVDGRLLEQPPRSDDRSLQHRGTYLSDLPLHPRTPADMVKHEPLRTHRFMSAAPFSRSHVAHEATDRFRRSSLRPEPPSPQRIIVLE